MMVRGDGDGAKGGCAAMGQCAALPGALMMIKH
jgi:hypothetical protein